VALRPPRSRAASRRLKANRVSTLPRPAQARLDAVAYPNPAEVPDWTAETAALLDDLTPLQSAFVQWMATGRTAAEAYRLAAGRDPGPTARNNAAQLARKPHVRAALTAALRDRNVGARCDGEWVLQKLFAVVERCERSGRTRELYPMI